MALEYSKSIILNGHAYGRGSYNAVKQPGREKTHQEMIDETRLAGWSHGCPIAIELTGSNSPYPLEWMLQRYTSVNRWFTNMCDVAKKTNPSLHKLLRRSVPRFPDELVGKHEPLSVPLKHLTHIAPMDTPWGNASPRLPLEIIKLGKNERDKLDIAYTTMVYSVQRTDTPRDLLVMLSKNAMMEGVEPVNILEHTLSAGTLEEENCRREYIRLIETLEAEAPDLVKVYLGLNSQEKAKLGIAEILYS